MTRDREDLGFGIRSGATRGAADADADADAGADAGEHPSVFAHVVRFIDLYESGEVRDPDVFADGVPESVREHVRERCREYIDLFVGAPIPADGTSDFPDLGDFKIIREIGSGGMGGVVYLAWQHSLQRRVALKILSRQRGFSARELARFEREARAAAKLQHPGIVRVLSVGQGDDCYWLAMDYIEGQNLADGVREVRRARSENRRAVDTSLTDPDTAGHARRVALIVQRIAEALHHAHRHGVIHRDVKPANIVLTEDEHPILVDFGLAKNYAEDSMSRTDEMGGTPYYMSPEQALAKRVTVDHRTDVFSLGVVLYELLTLQRPFEGDTVQRVLYEISFREPAPVKKLNRHIHRDLDTIVAKALEKSPEKRFATAQEMADELGRFLNGEPLSIRPQPAAIRWARHAVRRHPIPATVLASVVAGAAVLPLVVGAARAHERGSRVDEELVAIERVLPPDLRRTLAIDLRLAADRLERLRADGANEEQELRIAASIGRIRIEGTRRRDAAVWQASEALRVGSRGGAQLLLLRAFENYLDAGILLPDDADVAARANVSTIMSTITISGVPGGLPVAVHTVDELTGEVRPARDLGVTPIERLPMPAGYYRFVVEGRDGYCELTRSIDGMVQNQVIEAGLRPTQEVMGPGAGMVQIDAASFRFGQDAADIPVMAGRDVSVGAFWIDEVEVSIGDYKAFLADTGRGPPREWRRFSPETTDEVLATDRWNDRPVLGVTFEEARAYAEWRGKRLPTVFEWELAARGVQSFELPWAPTGEPDLTRCVLARTTLDARLRAVAEGHQLQLALDSCEPVRALPLGRSSFGLFHVLGNANEWTETMSSNLDAAGAGVSERDLRILKGGGWDWPARTDLSSVDRAGVYWGVLSFGFRCAKSVR